MSNTEGTFITISGDEYRIVKNYGDLLVLERNGFKILYFEKLNSMFPCTVKKIQTQNVIEDETKMTFMGVPFVKTGYIPGECGTKNITTSISGIKVTFNIENRSHKLLKVTY